MRYNKILVMVVMTIIPIAILVAEPTIDLTVPSSFADYGIEQFWNARIYNPDTQTYTVCLYGEIEEASHGVVFWAYSDSFPLPPGTRNIGYRDVRVVDSWAAPGYRQLVTRTGGLSYGIYTFKLCLMPMMICDDRPIPPSHPNPPRLVSPRDSANIDVPQPTFAWTPPQPPATGQVTYEIKIVEKLPSQTSLQAIQANPVWFTKRDIRTTNITYPTSARTLDTGKTYTWQVTAYSSGAEIGKSEAWSFSYGYTLNPPAPFIVIGYNCCKNFNSKVENLTVTEPNPGKYTLSGSLTAGPNPICKIQARIVNFSYLPVSIPPASNCPNCVWPSTKFGNFGPLVSIEGLTPPPTLTTISPFNYSREFIWQGNPFNVSSTPFSVSLLLPDASPLGACCYDTIKMSIRFLFTDTLCNTCDTVINFWFTRNPLNPIHIVYNEDFDKNSNAVYGFNSQTPNPNRAVANKNFPNLFDGMTVLLPMSTLDPDSSYSSVQTELAPNKIRLNETELSCYPTNNLGVPAGHNKSWTGNTCYLLATLLPISICRRKRRPPMKNIKKYIFVVLFFVFTASAAATDCCPKFSLVADFQPCDRCEPETTGQGGGIQNQGGESAVETIIACKNTPHTYRVCPNLTGFTFTWMIFGGTSTSYTGNPITITWGSSSQGFIKVIISNADGSCRDSITTRVCLIDGPTAAFSFAPNPVCLAPSVVQFTFTNAPNGGASFYWDFGDGSSSTLENPTHSYTAPGDYKVVLTVSTSADSFCKCRDIDSAVITVDSTPGIDIHSDTCRKMLCGGDTVKYCTSTSGCTGLNWAVNGGRIIDGLGTTCITVVWDKLCAYPTTVTLTANCPNTCGNSAKLFVPVLCPNLPIQGPNPVCSGSISTYSLPALPGTFYDWTITGDGNIITVNRNINFINVKASTSGSFTITCNYNNPYSGCGGTYTLPVTIMKKFVISGPSSICMDGSTKKYSVMGGGSANWTIIPTTGYTPSGMPPGTFSNESSIDLTWTFAGIYCITAEPINTLDYCTPSASIIVIVNPTPVLTFNDDPDVVICPDQLYNYSINSTVSGGNFEWSVTPDADVTIAEYGPNNSMASIIFPSTGTGSWTLTATQNVNGCTGDATLSIEKEDEPPPITITPPGSICSGGIVTASVTGSVPASGYTWSSTPGAVLTDGQGTTAATFIVNDNAEISISSCGGTSIGHVTIKTPSVNFNTPTGPCSATITATPSSVTCTWHYTWYLNGELTNYSGNEITVNQNGHYTVLAECNGGGCKATASIDITDITPVSVNITTTGTLCNDGSVTLQADVSANCSGATYTWSNGASSKTITVTDPGGYSVTVKCNNGCTYTSSISVPDCSGVPANCINDIQISPSNCPNPVNLTTNIPAGCTPVSTTWYYGDGSSNTTGNHLYANVGTYTVFALISCSDGTKHCGKRDITVPMVDSFTSVIGCGDDDGWKILLQDASKFLEDYAGYSIDWSTTWGTLSATNIPNPTLTVPFGDNPTVTLTISKNGCTLSKSFAFDLPITQLEIIGPTTVCKGANNEFSSNVITGVLTYVWNFGDDATGTTGVTNPILHAYDGTVTNPTITLHITNQYGCVFTATKTITVVTPRALTIVQGPLVEICPDCLPPYTLCAGPPGFKNHQWYRNGVAIEGATDSSYQLCNFDASGNYYVTAYDAQNNSCEVTSNTVQVVYKQKPVADIRGNTIQCISGIPGTFDLYNSDAGYTYFWTVDNPMATISPNNTQTVHVTVNDTGAYQFILTVTDAEGCMAKDTFCVYVYLSPTVTITTLPSMPSMCEGTMYTMTANAIPSNSNYIYQWSNGAKKQSITTGQAGDYSVTVTNPISGCVGYAYAGTIKERPYVDLFPLGCFTLCSTDTLIPPLPLTTGYTYNDVYRIDWYVDNDPPITRPELTGLSLGLHHIYIIVTDINTGCTSTSGTCDVSVVLCCCKNSRWGKMTYSAARQKHKMECGGSYNLKCNQPYTIDAKYICRKPKKCPKKVTYTITDQAGSTTTGNVPFTFTPTIGDNYLMTLYGSCGDSLCDSCKITFKTDCPPPHSKCQHCCDNVGINIQSQVAHYGSDWWGWYVTSKLTTTPNPIIEIRAELVNFYMNNKTGCERCVTENAYLGSILDIGAQSKINWPPLMSPASRSYSSASPRDLVWNRIVNGLYQQRPALTNEDVTFRIVFPPPHIFQNSCCFDTIWFCIRWSFTDVNCRTCDTLICYTFAQHYNAGGGNEPQPDTLPAGRRQSMLNILPNPENQSLYTQGQNGFKPDNYDLVNHYEVIETKPVKGCGCGKK